MVDDDIRLLEHLPLGATHLRMVLIREFRVQALICEVTFSLRKPLSSYVLPMKKSIRFDALVMSVGALDDLYLDVQWQRARTHAHLMPLLQYALQLDLHHMPCRKSFRDHQTIPECEISKESMRRSLGEHRRASWHWASDAKR